MHSQTANTNNTSISQTTNNIAPFLHFGGQVSNLLYIYYSFIYSLFIKHDIFIL